MPDLNAYLGRALLGNVDYEFTSKDKPELWKGAEADRAVQAQSRGEEGDYQAYLKNAMAGNAPSVAQQQMAAGRDQAIKAGQAVAAGARGSGVAQAGRGAAQAGAQAGMQNAQQTAIMRAGEQQAYAQQYGQAVQNKRMQDLMAQGYSLDQAKAQLSYDASIQQARSTQSIAETKANQSSIGAIAGAVGGALAMSDPTGKQDVLPAEGAGDAIRPNAAKVTTVQQPNLANALSKNPQVITSPPEAKYDMTVMGSPDQPMASPVRTDKIASQYSPYNMDTLPNEATPTAPQAPGSYDNPAVGGRIKSPNSDPSQPADQSPDPTGTNQISFGQRLGRALAGYSGGISGNMQQLQQMQAQQNSGLPQMGTPQASQSAGSDAGAGPGMQELGMGIGSAMSDPSLKTDINFIPSGVDTKQDLYPVVKQPDTKALDEAAAQPRYNALEKALEHPVSKAFEDVPAYSFRHKPEFAAETNAKFGLPPNSEYGNRLQYGVMAPDLAKNPVTQSSVIKDPQGHERVDTSRLTMTNTAGLADLGRRVSELEGGTKPAAFTNRDQAEPEQMRTGIGKYGKLGAAMSEEQIKHPQPNVDWLSRQWEDSNIGPKLEELQKQRQGISTIPNFVNPKHTYAPPLSQYERWAGPAENPSAASEYENKSRDPYLSQETRDATNLELKSMAEDKTAQGVSNLDQAKTPEARRQALRSLAGALGQQLSAGKVNPKYIQSVITQRGGKAPSELEVKKALREEYNL